MKDIKLVRADDSQGEGVRGEVEAQVAHGDMANDLVYCMVVEILLRIIRVMEEQKVIQRYRVMIWAHRMQRDRPK
jgi:hypothetical protein